MQYGATIFLITTSNISDDILAGPPYFFSQHKYFYAAALAAISSYFLGSPFLGQYCLLAQIIASSRAQKKKSYTENSLPVHAEIKYETRRMVLVAFSCISLKFIKDQEFALHTQTINQTSSLSRGRGLVDAPQHVYFIPGTSLNKLSLGFLGRSGSWPYSKSLWKVP